MHQDQNGRVARSDVTIVNAAAFAHRHELALGICVKRFQPVKRNIRAAHDVPACRQNDGKGNGDGNKLLEHEIGPPPDLILFKVH